MAAVVDSAGRLRHSEKSVPSLALRSDEHGSIAIPAGLSRTEFAADGDDLLVSVADGAQVLVRDYFARANPPELVFSDGVQLSRDVVAQLAGTAGASALASVEDTAVPFDEPRGRPCSDPDDMLSVATAPTVVRSFELPPSPTPTLTAEEVTAILREYNASFDDSD